ncbi:transglutaminase family protein [Streptomyces sp. NPDC127084]|uniref:transglutaminase-like domain-containing protein n=1 Tax=Streptomyces sp. NPDC127084 TaxID=3347133 RepID=UPI003649A6D5
MTSATNEPTTIGEAYLRPTAYLDSDHPVVVSVARALTDGATTDTERLGRIYHYVRDIPYDVLASFRYLAAGESAASDVLSHGVAFCMGKASSFVALSRASHIPARIAFQALDAPHMEFISPQVRTLWGGPVGRPLPWHSLGEAYLGGRWIKLDATIDPPTAASLGKPYTVAYDGITDIPTVEGPVLHENGSYADYPAEVARWYEHVAHAVLEALDSPAAHQRVATDDQLWKGPDPDLVRVRAVQRSDSSRA